MKVRSDIGKPTTTKYKDIHGFTRPQKLFDDTTLVPREQEEYIQSRWDMIRNRPAAIQVLDLENG